ncbi:MAG: hypothetical protein AAF662_03985, partial [Pseudomonadota bacterium]
FLVSTHDCSCTIIIAVVAVYRPLSVSTTPSSPLAEPIPELVVYLRKCGVTENDAESGDTKKMVSRKPQRRERGLTAIDRMIENTTQQTHIAMPFAP